MAILDIYKRLRKDITDIFVYAIKDLADKEKDELAKELDTLSNVELNTAVSILSKLTTKQVNAIIYNHKTSGPLLILGDAVSNKRMILSHMIAYNVVVRGLKTDDFFCVTFSNEAAGFIEDSVSNILPEKVFINLPIGTFQKIALKILNDETFGNVNIEKIGYKRSPQFRTIIGREQFLLLKRCYKENKIEFNKLPVETLINEIRAAKHDLISADDFMNKAKDENTKIIGKIYKSYQDKLIAANVGDINDPVPLVIKLFKTSIEVKKFYQEKINFLFVDEYHYANFAQHTLIKELISPKQYITFTGAKLRTTYAWAPHCENYVNKFKDDFKNGNILEYEREPIDLEKLIAEKRKISDETLEKEGIQFDEAAELKDFIEGKQIIRIEADDEYDQANFIVNKVIEYKAQGKNYSDMVVFFRHNKQIAAIEKSFTELNLPHKIIGDKLLERPEIVDTISLLKTIFFADRVAKKSKITQSIRDEADRDFLRALKIPSINISYNTQVLLEKIKKENPELNIYEILLAEGKEFGRYERRFMLEDREKIGFLLNLIKEIIGAKEEFGVGTLTEILINETGYLEYLKNLGTKSSIMRIKNLEMFDTYAYEFDETMKKSVTMDILNAFIVDIDNKRKQFQIQQDAIPDSILVATIHSVEEASDKILFFMI
jgi:DNA helicase-2/ATP-dependent DNA helicase PcrA